MPAGPRPFRRRTSRPPEARRRDCADRRSEPGGAPRGAGRPTANCGRNRTARAGSQPAARNRIRWLRARAACLFLSCGTKIRFHVELMRNTDGDGLREEAMQGLMSERPLLISAIIKHAALYHRDTEIVVANCRRRDSPLYLRGGRAARETARAGAAETGRQTRRPRRHSRLEHLSPFRALLRDLRDRSGLPHDQPSALR